MTPAVAVLILVIVPAAALWQVTAGLRDRWTIRRLRRHLAAQRRRRAA